MNLLHRKVCASRWWARQVERRLPAVLRGVDLGDALLEIGPGYGANLRMLVRLAPWVTALEIDRGLAARLATEYVGKATVVHGDGAAMPLPGNAFSAVVCFTMLHHVPTAAAQDQVFAEAHRVLRPGGVFLAADGVDSLTFRLIHLGDTCNPLDPDTLGERLRAAGFPSPDVSSRPGTFVRFTARKP